MSDSVTIHQPLTHATSVLGHGTGRHRGHPSEENAAARPDVTSMRYGRHRRFSHAAPVQTDANPKRRRIPDDERFEREVMSLLGPVYQAALYLTGSPDDAQALAVNTFERAYVSFPDLSPDTDLKCWLRRVLITTYFDADGLDRAEPAAAAVQAGEGTDDMAPLSATVTTDVHKELQPC